MKKLCFLAIAMLCISSSAFSGTKSLKYKANSKISSLVGISGFELFDGRTINFYKSVESFYTFDDRLDYLELSSGEIVDRTDVKSIFTSPSIKALLRGVDGGG